MVQTETLVAQAKIGARMPLLFLIKHISSSSASSSLVDECSWNESAGKIQSLYFVFKLPMVLCSQRQTRALGLMATGLLSPRGEQIAWWVMKCLMSSPHLSYYVVRFLYILYFCIFPVSAF